MTSAYSAFPNQGVRMTPLFMLDVTDRDGNVLEQHRPRRTRPFGRTRPTS